MPTQVKWTDLGMFVFPATSASAVVTPPVLGVADVSYLYTLFKNCQFSIQYVPNVC